VDEAVQDGVGEGRVTDPFVPVLAGELACDDRGAGAVAVFEHLEQIVPLGLGGVAQAQVVEDQQLRPAQLAQQLGIGAVRLGQTELVEEAGQTAIDHSQPAAARACPSAQAR
jgi:hypothetical protein